MVPGGSLGVPGGPWDVVGGSLGVPGGALGRLWSVLGGYWMVPGAALGDLRGASNLLVLFLVSFSVLLRHFLFLVNFMTIPFPFLISFCFPAT